MTPPGFPAGVPLSRRPFENWAGTVRVEDVWTCEPRTPDQVVELANWAHAAGYRLRARGAMHSWPPLTLAGEDRVVLVATTRLADIELASSSPPAVRVGTGATIGRLLAVLESHGLGFTAVPAPGDLSVGGVLAVDAHGTGVPAAGEQRQPGLAYGSLSNLVLSLTAVVWDERAGRYVLRSFDRGHPDAKALLVHLGRAFVTEVVLQAGPNPRLRCVSRVDVPASELFARPEAAGSRSLAAFVERSGRVEAIWFPFTAKPWLKLWSVAPTRPSTSREVSSPYNYPFSDRLPEPVARLAGRLLSGARALTPALARAQYAITAAVLTATRARDLWGLSKNVLLYVRPTTLRVHANGYAILCRRADIQRVVADATGAYRSLLGAHRRRGRYPINMPVEIRVTGLDVAGDVVASGAQPPPLSALTPRRDHPDWDVAVWFDVLTSPGTPGAEAFYRELEIWLLDRFDGSWAAARPEWSKGWGYSERAAWDDGAMLAETIPDLYRAGRGPDEDWDWARRTLDAYDPHRVWSNAFLDRLLDPGASQAPVAAEARAM